MLQCTSHWELKASAGSKKKGKGSTQQIGENKVQVFKLPKEKFKDAIDEYPSFRRFVFLRANLRRTNWKKVFEENRHQWLFKKKIEEAKVLNSLMGYEHRNEIFDQYENGDIWKETESDEDDPHVALYKRQSTKVNPKLEKAAEFRQL